MKAHLNVLLLLAILICAGCAPRLYDDREVTLEVGDIRTIVVDPVSRVQNVHVAASSPGAPVSVHVYLPEHEKAVERNITLGVPPEKVLAFEENSEKITLDVVVPANKKAIVRLQSAGRQPANVQLVINN